jgi:large subunit ribosomal protein L32e
MEKAEKERLLEIRKKIKKKKPSFKRQEWFRMKRLGTKWRKPRGEHSKLRRHIKARGALPTVGYRSPSKVRGLNREGLREVIVRNIKDMEKINKKEEIAIIASTVGKKKRLELLEYAHKNNIKVGNQKI